MGESLHPGLFLWVKIPQSGAAETCDADKEQCLASIPASLPEHHVGSRTLRQVALVTVTALPSFCRWDTAQGGGAVAWLAPLGSGTWDSCWAVGSFAFAPA